jgi:hypothetical protein
LIGVSHTDRLLALEQRHPDLRAGRAIDVRVRPGHAFATLVGTGPEATMGAWQAEPDRITDPASHQTRSSSVALT